MNKLLIYKYECLQTSKSKMTIIPSPSGDDKEKTIHRQKITQMVKNHKKINFSNLEATEDKTFQWQPVLGTPGREAPQNVENVKCKFISSIQTLNDYK